MACLNGSGRRHGARRAQPRGSGLLPKATVLALVLAGAPAADAQVVQYTGTAAAACAEFAGGESFSGWNLEVCLDIWDEWMRSIQTPLRQQYMDREIVVEIGERLRAQDSQCYAESPPVDDGIGSSAVRTIATWVFAEEMGCAWVRPHWGKGQIDSSGMTRYCHSSVSKDALALMTYDEKRAMFAETCVMVNWRQYFGFDKYSVEPPEGDGVKSLAINPTFSNWQILEAARDEVVANSGPGNLPWERMRITFDNNSVSSRYFLLARTWDERKREATRKVMHSLRESFDEAPQRGSHNPQSCGFDDKRLNFAIHIRLGDRRGFQGLEEEYFNLLDEFMDTVTAAVVEKGELPPVFHIFSETSQPCPPPETGAFEEFSAWPPVRPDQVQACWDADKPTDCPEKQDMKFGCKAKRTGVFHVQGRPVVLHVGSDVVKTMSCMIQSDGVLMGCSTFGHMAGLLTKGISFFSMRCGGEMTPAQYQMMPPIAVAERGNMWVPIKGSWRDPALYSRDIFNQALEQLIETKRSAAH